MSISKSFNKRTGITYVYDVYENYWDKEKKKYVQKRRMIGKIDPQTGEIVPTRSRKSKEKSLQDPSAAGETDYRALYLEAQKQLEQKELEISMLQSRISQLKKQISSVLNSVIPALEKQTDALRRLGDE